MIVDVERQVKIESTRKDEVGSKNMEFFDVPEGRYKNNAINLGMLSQNRRSGCEAVKYTQGRRRGVRREGRIGAS